MTAGRKLGPVALAIAIFSPAGNAGAHAAEPAPVVDAGRRAGTIVVDGRLDEPSWAAAGVGEGFKQNQPDEGAPASAATRFRVLWDDEALYVGIECEEPDEGTVVLGRRDHAVESDAVSIILDTQLDRRSGYRFTVFRAGQQLDGLQYDDAFLSTDWDAAWDSAVARTDRGWSVELRLPLRALRIPDGASELGMNVIRARAAHHEESIWRFTPRGTPGLMSQLGRLRGLDGLRPGRSIEIRPYVATMVSHDTAPSGTASGLTDTCSAIGVAEGTITRVCVGADFKLGLTSDLSLIGTINPDFGQTEVDQRVLNLTTFETFFPEKRPFFLEGLDLFQPIVHMSDWGGAYGGDALQLFYSRRIGAALAPLPMNSGDNLIYQPASRPVLAALKLAGQAGAASVAVLSAVENRTRAEILGADGTTYTRPLSEAAHSAALRARIPLGDSGFAGTTATAFDPLWAPETRHGYAGAVDFALFDGGRDFNLALQLTASHVEGGADQLVPDGTVLGSGATGRAASLRLAKDGGWLTGFVDVDWLSAKLDLDQLGFLKRANLARGFAAVTLRDLHASDLWQSALITTSVREIRTSDLRFTLHRDMVIHPEVTLSSFWHLQADLAWIPRRGDDRELGDGTRLEQEGGWAMVLVIDTDKTRMVSGQIGLMHAEYGLGQEIELVASTTIRPLPRFELQLDLDYTRTRDEIRRLRGATTVPTASGPPAPLDLTTATAVERLYLLAPRSAENLSATVRANIGLSPRLTLQLYAQLFAVGIGYGEALRLDVPPGTGPFPIQALTPAHPEDLAPIGDQRQASLDVNVILRWEWHVGSNLYVVYGHSTAGGLNEAARTRLSLDHEISTLALDSARSIDTLLVKIDFLSAL